MSYPCCPIGPTHTSRLVRSVLALTIGSLGLLALSGCHGYRFDARATNTTSENVRISIYKGKRHVKISSVIAAPGSVVSWTGQTRKPVIVRVEPANFAPGAGQVVEVSLPRRIHTDLTITSPDQNLKIISSQPMTACCKAPANPSADTTDTADAADEDDFVILPNAPQSDTPDTPANADKESAEPTDQDTQAGDDSDDSDPAVDLVEDDDEDGDGG